MPLPIIKNPMDKGISRSPGLFSLWVPLGLASRAEMAVQAAGLDAEPETIAVSMVALVSELQKALRESTTG